MKLFYYLFALIITTLTSYAQDPQIVWQNTIGGDVDDGFTILIQTIDGGYIMGGSSESNISGDKTENSIGDKDYWIVKVNDVGIVEWDNTIGGSNIDILYSLAQTTDGGYILGGWSDSDISGDKTENSIGIVDYWIVKLNASGNIEWDNTIGGNNKDWFGSLVQTSDGGFIIGGESNSDISGDKTEDSIGEYDFWVLKFDSAGNIEWQNTIGGNNNDGLESISQTMDGGYILGGYSFSNISGDKTENNIGEHDYWVVKLDNLGNVEWDNTIGGDDFDFLWSLVQTSDGGYLLGGSSKSNISGDKTEDSIGEYDYWVVKLNESGEIEWENTIGGYQQEELWSVFQTLDGNFLLGGWSNSNISGDKTEESNGYFDFWSVLLDTSGAIIWQNTIGGSNSDYLHTVIQTTDGQYVLGGNSKSNISGDKTENSQGGYDYWILKLSPTLGLDQFDINSSIYIYPNPVQDDLNIESQLPIETVKIYSLQGQLIKEESSSIINVSQLNAGLYFVQITIAGQTITKKFIKE